MYVIVSKTASPKNIGPWADVGNSRRNIYKVQSIVAGHNAAQRYATSDGNTAEPYRAEFFRDNELYKEPFRTDYREGDVNGGPLSIQYRDYAIWAVNRNLKSFYIAGYGASVNQLFRSIDNAKTHIDWLIKSFAQVG